MKKKYAIAHWPSRKLSFLFFAGAVVILVLISGLVVAAMFKKSLKGAFTPTLQPTTPIPTKKLPDSCYQNPDSEPCKRELAEILNRECGGDLEAPACAPYFQEAVALQTAHECQKDPNSTMCQCLKEKSSSECLGQKIRSETFGKMFCEMAKQPIIGQAFTEVCRNLTGSVPSQKSSNETPFNCQANPYDPNCQNLLTNYCQSYPYQPECATIFAQICSQDISNPSCVEYCQQAPNTDVCVAFLLQYCKGRISDPLCMSVLCQRSPNLCTLCQQFPNLCNQLYQ